MAESTGKKGRDLVLIVTLILAGVLPWLGANGQGTGRVLADTFRLAQSPDCGTQDVIAGEDRTKVPWTASIFYRMNGNTTYRFLLNGVIIGPTTILSVSGGAYGDPGNGHAGKYRIPNASKIRIGAGLISSNFEEQDSFAQYSDVTYVLPYNGHEKNNEKFHFMLYHLKTPLDLSGPYVRAICLPFVLRGRKATPYQFEFLQGGFTLPPGDDGTLDLKVFRILGGSEQECAEEFATHYNATSAHVFCGRIVPSSNRERKCLVHGSVVAFRLASRWFLGGINSLIPAIKHRVCDPNGIYFYARTLLHLDWMFNSFRCSPNNFACQIDGSCVPLTNVCNSIPDCKDESDEDPILCGAQNRCHSREARHSCGLNGKCISEKQLCDHKRDCPNGSDENPYLCNGNMN